MVKGSFQVANEKTYKVSVISQVKSWDGRSVTYEYQEFIDPVLPHRREQVLAKVLYGDGTQAVYQYGLLYSDALFPLLVEAKDPRYPGPAVHMKYEYSDETAFGTVKREINGVTGEEMVRLDTVNATTSKVSYANGSVQTFNLPTAQAGQLNFQVDGLGRRTDYTYDQGGLGFLTDMKDALGRMTHYTKSDYDNPLSITRPDGSIETWTRDDRDLVLTHTEPRFAADPFRTTTYTRDALHRITRMDHPDGTFELFTYNDFGQVLTHTMRNGGVEQNFYDKRGLKTRSIDSENDETRYSYDSADRLASMMDARGNTTLYEYDERGLLTKVTHPITPPDVSPTFRTFAYDEFGNRVKVTDELGHEWTTQYDEFRRVKSKTDSLNRVTQYAYDLPGGTCGCVHSQNKPTQITLPSGKIIKIEYDLEWQKTKETVGFGTPDAATTMYGYDLVGNLTKMTDPRGKVWSSTYDSRNRRKSSTDPLGNTTQWDYDSVSNVLKVTRPDNGVTVNEYDLMNRLTKTTDPKNQVTQMEYDAEGNLKKLTDANGNMYGFQYDRLNRRTKEIYPDNSQEGWTYDPVSNLATRTTRAGQVRTYTYDERNRETLSDWNDTTPDVSSTYDAANRLLTLTSSVSSLSYTYDVANQLLSETQAITGAPSSHVVSYTYDLDGNRDHLTNPDGTVVGYGYTGRNQLATISVGGPLASYTYDLNGNRIGKSLANGTTVDNGYDDSNRMTLVDQKKGGVSFARFDYGYDSVDRRKFVKRDNDKGDAFAYDPIDQVTGVQYDATNPDTTPTAPSRTVNYGLDPVGNRTSVTDNSVMTNYSANNLNQYTQVGADLPTYDTNGNLTASAGWSYSYDAQNRLIGAGKGATTAAFAYDPRNRRVKQTINGVTTHFYFDGWNLIEERDASDTQVAKYVHGAMTDELLTRATPAGALSYHHDSIGNVTQLTDSSGAVVEKYSYDIFGQPAIRNGSGVVIPTSQRCRQSFPVHRPGVHPGAGALRLPEPLRFAGVGSLPANRSDWV